MSERINLLGIRLSAFNLKAAVEEMQEAVRIGARAYVCTCPVGTLMRAREDPEVRRALAGADWITPDGMPVAWSLKALGGRDVGRVYGPDLMLALSKVSCEQGWSQYYLGGGPGVADELAVQMKERFPGLLIAGTQCPPFRELTEEEEKAMVDRINASGAKMVWVGLGSPKQDLWMAKHRARLTAPLLIAVGAAFDFLTGRVPQAPCWMQNSGLEWVFRLACEPRRLWRRYLFYNPRFLGHLFLQLTGLRRYDS